MLTICCQNKPDKGLNQCDGLQMSRPFIRAERFRSPLIDVFKYILVVAAITWLIANTTGLKPKIGRVCSSSPGP